MAANGQVALGVPPASALFFRAPTIGGLYLLLPEFRERNPHTSSI
jgi:hypothetical protein